MARNLGAPPATNRGVQNTSGLLIDWFQGTFPDGMSLNEILGLFGSEWQEASRGAVGYKYQLINGLVRVLYGGREGMGIHVVCSGQACRQLEAEGKVTDWPLFLTQMAMVGMSYSRLDIAYDDFDKKLDLKKVESAVSKGQYVGRFKACQPWQKLRLKDGKNEGKTIYFGSTKSECMVRMYDKAAEQGIEGIHWTRVELQLRDDRAEAFVWKLCESNPETVFKGVLLNYIDFRRKDSDTNRSRWDQVRWWREFIGQVEKCKLTIKGIVKTIEDKIKWVEDQISPTLALILMHFGGDIDRFVDIVNKGRCRLRPSQLAILGGVG